MRSRSASASPFAARVLVRRVHGFALGVLAGGLLAGCAPTEAGRSPASPGTPVEEGPTSDSPRDGGIPSSAAREPSSEPNPMAPPSSEPNAPGDPSRSPEAGAVVQAGRASTVELTARKGEAVRVLRVVIDEVYNPRSQNLVLVVTARLPSAPLELGRLSFYPVTRGGTFVLPLPAPAVAQVEISRALTVQCTLEVQAGSDIEGVRARVRSLALMPAP